MGTTTSLLTFEEFERLPDEPGKDELLDGELIHLPPPQFRHLRIAHKLFLLLTRYREALCAPSELGEIYIEGGYKLGHRSWLQPDVSITHPNQPRGIYLEGAPLIAIEVISESNRPDRVDRKRRKYLEHGSREVWVVYPDTETVVIHKPGESREYSGTLTSDLLPGLTIDLKQFFQ